MSLATNLIACNMHLSYKMRQVGKKREASWSPASGRSGRELFHVFLSKIYIKKKKNTFFVYLADWQTEYLIKSSRVSKAGVLFSPQMQEMALHHHQLQHHHHLPDGSHYNRNQALINSSPPMLSNPMSALTQLNLQVSRGALPHGSPSPPGSKSATPSPSSSNQEEEAEAHLKVLMQL